MPSVRCAAAAFLNISTNISSTFKSSIIGARKGGSGNGLLRTSDISMDAFVARDFDDNSGNWHCFGEKSTVSLTRSASVLVTYMVQHR